MPIRSATDPRGANPARMSGAGVCQSAIMTWQLRRWGGAALQPAADRQHCGCIGRVDEHAAEQWPAAGPLVVVETRFQKPRIRLSAPQPTQPGRLPRSNWSLPPPTSVAAPSAVFDTASVPPATVSAIAAMSRAPCSKQMVTIWSASG